MFVFYQSTESGARRARALVCKPIILSIYSNDRSNESGGWQIEWLSLISGK